MNTWICTDYLLQQIVILRHFLCSVWCLINTWNQENTNYYFKRTRLWLKQCHINGTFYHIHQLKFGNRIKTSMIIINTFHCLTTSNNFQKFKYTYLLFILVNINGTSLISKYKYEIGTNDSLKSWCGKRDACARCPWLIPYRHLSGNHPWGLEPRTVS